MCLQYTKSQLKASLQTKTELSETEIEDVLKTLDDVDIHGSCSSSLSTEYNRKQYFEENFPYVHPQPIFLGFDENRKEQYAQYVPIKHTLTTLLKHTDVLEQGSTSENESSTHFK